MFIHQIKINKFAQENEARRSFSVEISWGVRFNEMNQVFQFIENLSKEVGMLANKQSFFKIYFLFLFIKIFFFYLHSW